MTDTFLITNTPSIEEVEEFDRHVLHHQYSLHWWSWGVWQTRFWSSILPPLEELMSLRGTFLMTNTPSIYEAEEFDRHVHHHQYSLNWWSWRVWRARPWSPILPPIKKLKSLTDTFLITNTPSINEAEILTDTFLITNTPSIEGAEEIERQILDHQYSLHWRNWGVWQTRSWSPILPPLVKLMSLTDTFLITNTPSLSDAEEFDWHFLDHQYFLHWWS